MGRSRTSAKQAGARFERKIADHLKNYLSEFIDRRVKNGAKDKGDIVNVRTIDGKKVVIEAKEYGGRLHPSQWIAEAHAEAENDGAAVGVVVAKRMGTAKAGEQYVLMTLDDLIVLLGGERPSEPLTPKILRQAGKEEV